MKIIKELSDKNLDIIYSNLKLGNLVVIPTETVYGLAADALNPLAIKKIFQTKGRPNDNPLIVHISNMDMMDHLVNEIPHKASILAKNFWPGPLTIILKKKDIVPNITTGNLNSVALRMPSHPMALKIIDYTGIPLAAPSANLSGKPSPTTVKHCINDLKNKIDIIVDGGSCNYGIESSVISLLDDKPILLRPGIITKENIENVIGPIKISEHILHKTENNKPVISPGMKYKHYAPNAQVILIKSNLNRFINYIKDKLDDRNIALVFEGEETYINGFCLKYGKKDDPLSQSKNLFKMLRKIDEMNIDKVYVRCPEIIGIGLAVYNRLIRAANFNIIEL